MDKAAARYNVSLGPKLDAELEQVAAELDLSKAEVMRRALNLYVHAVKSKEVKLVTDQGERSVLIK